MWRRLRTLLDKGDVTELEKLRAGARDVRDKVAPSHTRNEPRYFVMDEACLRVYSVIDYPSTLRFAAWRNLEGLPVWLSLFIRIPRQAELAEELRQRRTVLEGVEWFKAKKGRHVHHGRVRDLQDIGRAIEELESGERGLLFSHLYVGVVGRTPEELGRDAAMVEDVLRVISFRAIGSRWKHERDVLSLIPLGINWRGEGHQRNMTPEALAVMFPFHQAGRGGSRGLFMGVGARTGRFIFLDPFRDCTSPHAVVLGKTRYGKSVLFKVLIDWALMTDPRAQVLVLDIEREYLPLCRALGGQYIDLGGEGGTAHINVLDVDPGAWRESWAAFRDWCTVALGEMTRRQANIVLFQAWLRVMREAGFDFEEGSVRDDARPPLLSDLYRVLAAEEDPDAQELAARLYPYAEEPYGHIFNHPTTVTPRSRLVVFGLRKVEEDIRAVAMWMLWNFIWTHVLGELAPRYILVDEGWWVLKHGAMAEALETLARRLGKRWGSLWIATHCPEDLLTGQAARVIRSLADVKVLFHMDLDDELLEAVRVMGSLSPPLAERVRVLRRGQFILATPGFQGEVHLPLPPSRYPLYTTKPQEVAALEGSPGSGG